MTDKRKKKPTLTNQARHEAVIARFIPPHQPPLAMYDIGVGPKTEWRTLGGLYPKMQLHGCEPHPVTFQQVRKAGFRGPLHPVAIGETEGTARLHDPAGDHKCATLLPLLRATRHCDVQVWTLDHFDQVAGCPDRILLWMDIEGMELAALKSGPELLASGRVRWINLEERRDGHTPAEGWCQPEELQAFLAARGYIRHLEYNRHSTHQDVIYLHKDEKPCASSR